MQEKQPKIRLYVELDLDAGGVLGLPANQAHYLRSVMRARPGQEVALFNGRDGEWRARIDGIGKGWVSLEVAERLRPQATAPDIWLLFAPIKRGRIDYLVQKATELGVGVLQPVSTKRTVVERINLVRLAATAAEAAEQCQRLSVPELRSVQPLDRLVDRWPVERRLLFCDEAGAPPPVQALPADLAGPWAILIGPEGGFDENERRWLRGLPFVVPVSLGPRVLRSETAAVAALALWQALLGDCR
ncbi:MAG: 16S rRNA (uracil(1498)-N(3))-methyltransferase [Alphaproteobacteria bacterium]|jgi:16S rRNA (uracil1498-N3)-methyltransferase|nr:16S rRNA (uracil(1498)-N(3))-methyltransferase [Alphaproteobacteria bacterium]MDP6566051.1 16S rRNA (uracil(1498)-N(3))-methyltransferase [Alphaproteobacteria bacterium]MDP6816114.1 16S rRNA (uracil(1498)-N(3))-methyltransferase [Alphaproteobacteria bacterium]